MHFYTCTDYDVTHNKNEVIQNSLLSTRKTQYCSILHLFVIMCHNDGVLYISMPSRPDVLSHRVSYEVIITLLDKHASVLTPSRDM